MENKKAKRDLLILALLFVVLIGGAAALYTHLIDKAENQPSAVQEIAAPFVTAVPTADEETAKPQATAEVAGPQPKANLAKDFTVYTDDGVEKRLIDLRGKPAVINFFASWCGPCKSEMPYFDEAYKAYGDQIAFMMVDLCAYGNDTKESAKALVASGGWTFPVYFDTEGSAATAYSIRSMPTTIFVTADGELAGKQIGAMTEAQLKAQIDQLLAE